MSYDENFGSVSRSIVAKNSISKFRLSLFSLRIGESAYYLFSIKEKNFNFFYQISIPDLLEWYSDVNIDKEYGEFGKKLYETKENEKVTLISEFYSNEINKLENGFSQTFNKCLAYIALVAFIAPFFLTFITTINVKTIWIYIVLILIIFYCLGNLFLLILSFVKVKTYRFLRESEIHKFDDMERTRTLLHFHTYKIMQKKSRYHVSIITNIERYIKFFILWAFGTWVILFLWQFINSDQHIEANLVKEVYDIVDIDLRIDNNSSFHLTNRIELAKINRIINNNNKQIIILYSDQTPKILNENLKSYINLNIPKNSEVIHLEDKDIETNRYKILIRGDEK